ncbi:xanthine dehydrogenase, partial [Plastoroseomonas hellenica]|uniref:xanthine dehydrogenase n=1 Tax=Plastoroseomonas hellenica TaxID=2687306 RepID=UPI001BA51EB9
MAAGEQAPVLVRGVGDVGSAVAVGLLRAGYRVALHDGPAPTTPRRGMAFADAVFDGAARLDGIAARLVESPAALRDALAGGAALPVAVLPFPEMLGAAAWGAIVDARMRKRALPEPQRGLAPLTIGLGPNFIAGETVDLAIETRWGDRLGDIVEAGPTLPLEGEPRAIGGAGRARFAYAPAAGRFETDARIGQAVAAEEVVAAIAGRPLR